MLRDADPVERKWGIEAGLAWGAVADATVVYVDRGMSGGMEQGTARARAEGRPVEYRTLRRWSTDYYLASDGKNAETPRYAGE